ncbi:MAG: hypothetical protein INQ03_12445 [Candidatus Heimdallarchaeota archaeon]|nr:hypothetical protein [Candidatus Heimdallarchaeota archaeon]
MHNKVKQTILENIRSPSLKSQLIGCSEIFCPRCKGQMGTECSECGYTRPYCVICYQEIVDERYFMFECCEKKIHLAHYNKLGNRCPYCKANLR